ncbi:MAG: type II/IV secretion system ATPase subunit [Candidatus Aenigmarchaeota archaeon]|nr:type II/IV secretion system ATPase subunit [Candidatus Aenigmarchaeota archaeon]
MTVRTLVQRLKRIVREQPYLVEQQGGWKITGPQPPGTRMGQFPPYGGGGGSIGGGGSMEMKFSGHGGEGPLKIEVVEKIKSVTLTDKDLLKMPAVKSVIPETVETEEDSRTINTTYPLVPAKPAKGERIYAYANIKWDPQTHSLVYNSIEPPLSQDDAVFLKRLKDTLQERLDVSFTKIRSTEAEKYLDQKIDEVLQILQTVPDPDKKQVLVYYIKRDFIGLGKLEPLMHDPYIEDISCDGTGIPIFIYHRNPKIASVPTNIVFEDKEELDSFVFRLAQKSGRSISVADPLVDAALPDGSRLQATLSTDIARRGSNFTIRKFTERPLTPADVINFGTCDPLMMAYFWFCIENGKSVLISGGTATGKTTLLNVLSMFIRPEMKIVSIEDTPELKLTHPHWVPEVAREAISTAGEKNYGKVDLFDLLKSSLRQRPDYIIVGEVRGAEAYVLFQQIATGHTGLSTLHAENMEKLVDRLVTAPISLPPSLVETLDIVIFVKREKRKTGYVRRIENIYEIVGFDREKNFPITNEVFRWDPVKDTYITPSGSYLAKKIAEHLGQGDAVVSKELLNRTSVLEWMRQRNVTDYRDVAKILALYYANPEAVMQRVEAELS